MKLSEFYAQVAVRHANRSERFGQAFFNELDLVRPDLADRIHLTDLDPYYVSFDDNEFWDSLTQWIWVNW